MKRNLKKCLPLIDVLVSASNKYGLLKWKEDHLAQITFKDGSFICITFPKSGSYEDDVYIDSTVKDDGVLPDKTFLEILRQLKCQM